MCTAAISTRIVVDSKDVAKRIKEFFKIAPRTKNAVEIELYDSPVPLFHQANIEREIEQMYSRHVPLPSGGSLVIDSDRSRRRHRRQQRQIPRAQRRGDDRVQNRHGSGRRNPAAAKSCAIWAA